MNPKMIVEIVVAVIQKLQEVKGKKKAEVAQPVNVMIPTFGKRKAKGKRKRR